jgi:hypothetical protein
MPGFDHPLCLQLDGIDRSGRFHVQRYQLL